jgi:homoserine kinase
MSRVATVSVPATSANLGPGFDSIGLALDIRDKITARVVDSGVNVRINGNGADSLPTDATHLIAKVILETADDLGLPISGLEIECTNAIPQGRGLGSSASAIIAGLVLARALTESDMTDEELLQRANVFEGHADNISACLLGGLTVAWWNEIDDVKAISLDVHRDIDAVIGVPNAELSTEKARGLLPAELPYGDAVFNASRTALLVAAMTTDPSLLLDATADRLHQDYRRAAYPESMAIVDALRAAGIAGTISGAGPTVLALTTGEGVELAMQIMREGGFDPREVDISRTGAELTH